MSNEIIFDDDIIHADFDKIKNSNRGEPLPDNSLSPVIPLPEEMRDATLEESQSVNNYISSISIPTGITIDNPTNKFVTTLTILDRACSGNDVMNVLVDQINGLQQDIKDLEEMRDLIKQTMLSDPKSYRSAYQVENKLKTFTGFYSTILSYKKELNGVLFKLRDILTNNNTLGEQVKDAIKDALMKREEIATKTEDNKKRLQELIQSSPGLMPTSL